MRAEPLYFSYTDEQATDGRRPLIVDRIAALCFVDEFSLCDSGYKIGSFSSGILSLPVASVAKRLFEEFCGEFEVVSRKIET